MAEEATTASPSSEKVSQIVDLFMQLNVVELLELQETLEARGIKPVAAVAIGAGPAAGPAEEAPVKTSFDVILKGAGAKKIQVIKEVRSITSLGLKEAKDLVESAPKAVKEGVTQEEADKIKEKLEAAGAEVELK